MALGDFPLNITRHPQVRFAAVPRCGHGRHEIAVVDLDAAKVVSRSPVPEAFYGLEFSHTGARLYCSGAADEVIHLLDFEDGNLKANQRVPLRDARQRGIPCGLALSRDGRSFYVANVWGQCVSLVDLRARTNRADIVFTADACGTLPGRRTPRAFLADNDCGLGLLVEGVTHSSLSWRTLRRTVRTMWMRTAAWLSLSARTRGGTWWIPQCIPPAACWERSS